MLLAKIILTPANFFSIKRAESYQYAPSYLLPPPSTLLGAFARGLFLLKRTPAPRNIQETEAMIITATARALTVLTRTSTILKRMRTLEPREEVEKEAFRPRTDAMVREIVSLPRMECYYLLNKDETYDVLGGEVETELKRIAYSIDRLGDSESLVSVLSVDIITVEVKDPPPEVSVKTILEKDLTEEVSGNYIYTIMPDLRDRSKPKEYYVPLSTVPERTDVYHPSAFSIKPKKNVSMVKAYDVPILFFRDH